MFLIVLITEISIYDLKIIFYCKNNKKSPKKGTMRLTIWDFYMFCHVY